MKLVGEGEFTRDPDGRLRFRAKRGTFSPDFGDGRGESTSSTSLTAPAAPLFLTDEEAWDIFDEAARGYLKMSGVEFLQRWDDGEYPDPDAEEGVMSVVMLIPLVRPSVQGQ